MNVLPANTISENKILAVIFDIDGTLIDSVDLHARAWQEAFRHFGVEVSFQAARDQIGKGGNELLPVFLSDEQIAKFGDEIKDWRGAHFKKNYLLEVKPFPFAHDLLQRVKLAKKKLAAGSSAHRDELDMYIELLNARELFDVVTCSDDAEKSKPNPDIFQAALSKLEVAAENAIVIGDSPYDAEAASRAGIKALGFLCGGFPREWLLQANAVEIYTGPGELLLQFEQSIIERPQLKLTYN